MKNYMIAIVIISIIYGFSFSMLQKNDLLGGGINLILFVSYVLIMVGVVYFLKMKKSG